MQRMQSLDSKPNQSVESVANEADTMGSSNDYENVESFLGCAPKQHTVHQRDIYEGIEERGVDRVVLDVPEPWRVVPHAAESLVDGGLFVAYIPTTLQLHEVVQAHPETFKKGQKVLFLHTGGALGLYDKHEELAALMKTKDKGELGNISAMDFQMPPNSVEGA